MILSVLIFVFVAPMMVIAGWVCIFRELTGRNKPKDDHQKNKYTVRYETPQEEECRINEYGYDDESCGKL